MKSKTVVGACLLLPNKLNFRIKFSERSKKKELKAVFFSSFKLTHLPERIGCDLDGRRQKIDVAAVELLYISIHERQAEARTCVEELRHGLRMGEVLIDYVTNVAYPHSLRVVFEMPSEAELRC
ncbi:uncharacterized protein PITG_20966 [Phytophthora infestans T30-4]|uniref:Uncharacterized protein n=1 Tax=Phytophthora infestans (strain T30-4) TaxID=403677 RepID=D0P2W6_PHYIT|nr:uncharacterized protein PITG_20966 [Phytophthora infestans T30-4]EEY57105.1 hypothetical protein PITG_20966 [Phytophthora infestans T30-4]|eukprot:XP_002895363.1 hypothetical protein PITG_20966 [Phytophthora infestans T30-4]